MNYAQEQDLECSLTHINVKVSKGNPQLPKTILLSHVRFSSILLVNSGVIHSLFHSANA